MMSRMLEDRGAVRKAYGRPGAISTLGSQPAAASEPGMVAEGVDPACQGPDPTLPP